MIDKVLLRIMRRRSDYFKLKDIIPKTPLDEITKAILDDFGKYYELHPNHIEIDMQEFIPRFRQWHPKMKDETYLSFVSVLRACSEQPDEEQYRNIVRDLSSIDLMTQLANLAEAFEDGDVEDAYEVVTLTLDKYRKRLGLRATNYIDTPIGDLLQDEVDDAGVSWRLECLNASMRGLRPGDFGIVAGRPDKGKTSFLASEITHMAPQLPEDRNIIWLNNEGLGKRIIPRLYQAALNLRVSELTELHQQGKLVGAYRDAIGGRLDKVRIFDIHGCNVGQVEAILEENNPGIVVYDMIDNIRGFGDAARTDLALEQMYQWGRERSVKYDCIGIATSQISNEGDGEMFPTLGMLKDSKTGKQGACDFQIMIGASNDPNLMGMRYIGIPKNKLRRPDGKSDPRAEVIFDGVRSRYTDIPVGE
ncbi:AAA family ATPase [Pannonibacter sp. SL95]|uniref:AAA family ATPase n=1 Tax=Pannonibacter sp. SL95 TaxID=2995153 RepID=UPI002276661F|nr:AAA family ATPase [Pannonibacter sp. SL95]MCY1708377.1 AAA family ATPase [Pannonibacter sp. SL95]